MPILVCGPPAVLAWARCTGTIWLVLFAVAAVFAWARRTGTTLHGFAVLVQLGLLYLPVCLREHRKCVYDQ